VSTEKLRIPVRTRARFLWVPVCLLLASSLAISQSRPTRLAVLDFGTSSTGLHAAAKIRKTFHAEEPTKSGSEFQVIDPDQSRAAALGVGFKGSLNMVVQEARDLGSAMGCDFFFVGEAQTVSRSPSAGPDYYESYAAVFLVSARTGRLILWERPAIQRDSPEAAEKALLAILSSDETRQRYAIAMRRAQERAERAAAIEGGAPILEVMSEGDTDTNRDVRAPRPYRRLKPPYPETAAHAEVEATVDVLVDIDPRGEVNRVEIARWAGYGLDQSVVDTVRQLHFFPAMRDGVAIPIRALLRYNFRKPPPEKGK
jgi:TonB family protein